MDPLTSRFLAEPVRNAEAGAQFWFLYVDRPRSPVLLCPMDTTPGMENLQALYVAAGLTAESSVVQGRASIADDGAVEFTSPKVSAEMLPRLAAWVQEHVRGEPALHRFAGARFIKTTIGHRAKVESRLEDATLWTGLRRPSVPGTLSQTVERMGALRSGERAWFWLTDSGPGGTPYLHLSLAKDDPDCQLFKAEILALRARSGEGTVAFGVLIRTSFLYTPTSTEPIPQWGALTQGLIDAHGAAHPALQGLAAAPLTYVRAGRLAGFEESRCVLPDCPDNLLRELAVLQHVRGDERAWFWLTDADHTGHPRLCMAAEKDALRPAVKAARAQGRVWRGTVKIARGTPVELHTRGETDGLREAMRRWISRHRVGWPIVRLLKNATLIQLAEDGAVLARHPA